jgi:glutamate-5-semialdehyde dehydrogenase
MEARADRGEDLESVMRAIGRQAREAAGLLAQAAPGRKTAAIEAAAAALRVECAAILAANARDLAEARDLTKALIDRLRLDEGRVEAMAKGLDELAARPDPIGTVLAQWTRPNGLAIERVRVPLGVVGIIFESRPNVTADAGAICVKSGNAAILRAGSESFHSSRVIADCLGQGLSAAGLPATAVQLLPTRERAAVGHLLAMPEFVDVIVPRGGRGLIERVQREARMPVIAHLEGVNHTYIHAGAELAMARRLVLNAKMRRPGVCGATETLLVDRAVAPTHLPPILADLAAAGCELRGDEAARALDSRVLPASEADWDTEYLDAIIAVRVVDGLDAALAHIARHGSRHTEAIVSEDAAASERFLREVDAAIVMANASTQFADGAEFGMGAEIGISTGRLPPRGPVGADELTSYKYVLRGAGQVRG